MKKYIVELTGEQREELAQMVSTGRASARQLTHARILLKADQGPHGPGWSDAQIQVALDVSAGTVGRVRKRCAQVGVQEAILPQHAQRMRRRRLDGTQEAYLIALVCSQAPRGFARWTLRRFSNQLVELGYVETVSHETVRQVLLTNELKPWIKKQWCIPTPADADFVYHMEDVLEVYTRPYDPARPQVCMDEVNTQLLADTREALPIEPGMPVRQDYEYERQGVCNIFLACEPLVGKRYTMVAPQRTKQQWAQFMRRRALEHYPTAEKIVLVMDTLNTHKLAALYEVFPKASARRLCQRFEVHYTPKHASWLEYWPRSNSRCWTGNACRNGWPPSMSPRVRSLPGPPGAISSRSPLIGALPLPMRASNSNTFTHQYKFDRVLSTITLLLRYCLYSVRSYFPEIFA